MPSKKPTKTNKKWTFLLEGIFYLSYAIELATFHWISFAQVPRVLERHLNVLRLISVYRNTPFTWQDGMSEWRGNGGLIFGMSGDECIGIMRLDAKRTYHTLSSFVISPSMRGKGIGSQWMRQLDCIHTPIYLQVKQDNIHAIHLYEQSGFEMEDVSNGRYIMRKDRMQ